ncbi:zinc finger CCCH domain-containing protein 18-like [Panicum miliaceum]|uniref:Zinc finger CCCH domain-containing protein 18-like n=1 Tax=Panicum miliaceum TaxID=4540 RepID=A0A3L6RSF1_PANMI|nr:zinc finger CCCH domain-containing protein 18-like [Panicum miliaceum]
MASAVASNVHAGPAAAGALSFGWLGPRLSFGGGGGGGGRDALAAAVVEVEVEEPRAEPAISKDFIDFEFSLGGSATMLPADELFADGKLLPLRPQAAAGKAEAEPERERRDTALVAEIPPSTPERVKALHPAAAEAALDPYVFSPKAPTCSSRWRELLRLRKVQTPQKPSPSASPSASPAPTAATPSRASTSSAARSLKLLLQRNGRASGAAASDLSAAPLLRDSSDSEASLSLASSRFSLSSSSSSSAHDHEDFPRHSVDSVDPTPRPRIRLVRSHPHQPAAVAAASAPARGGPSPVRRRPSTPQPPPPPSVVSVDSPRMNASGKIVFQGLERSSSSPAGSVHSMRSRSRVMDRSYSAGVLATPVVLNVPVCSRPVFGFFKDKKDGAAKDAASGRPRSALGRRTPATPATCGASCRDLGNGD